MSTVFFESAITTYELHRVDASCWVIRDHAFDVTDAQSVVACVNETDAGDVEVIWLRADVALPTRYADAVDVLADLIGN